MRKRLNRWQGTAGDSKRGKEGEERERERSAIGDQRARDMPRNPHTLASTKTSRQHLEKASSSTESTPSGKKLFPSDKTNLTFGNEGLAALAALHSMGTNAVRIVRAVCGGATEAKGEGERTMCM
jgi:hypothetical protein